MKRCISFSLFDSKHNFEFLFYVRGLVLNVLMIKQLAPDYAIVVHVERAVFIKYKTLFETLSDRYDVGIEVLNEDTPCRMMLWRMKPIFTGEYDYVFCRDADALVTRRDLTAMSITTDAISNVFDNKAHSGYLMGGMSAYGKSVSAYYETWSNMLAQSPININKHGTDQDFLNYVIYRQFKGKYQAIHGKTLPHDNASDLCVSFIGAAGFNEMETLRYLRGRGVDITLGGALKLFTKEFYWI